MAVQRIIGCDVGIVHLGLAVIEGSMASPSRAALHLECVDVTHYSHDRQLNERTCSLPHTREISDRVMHAIADREDIFLSCDAVVIERQPMQGLQAVRDTVPATPPP